MRNVYLTQKIFFTHGWWGGQVNSVLPDLRGNSFTAVVAGSAGASRDGEEILAGEEAVWAVSG